MISCQIENGVATVKLAHSPVNAINTPFIEELHRALDSIEAHRDVALLIFDSDERAFSAGADLQVIQGFFGTADGPVAMQTFVASMHRLFDRIENLPLVTLAAMRRTALGGGLELALSCDLRLAAEDAVLGLPEARVGMIPGAGGTQRLTQLCGRGVASRLILACEAVDGREAERLGLVQWAVASDAFDKRLAELARSIPTLSRPALAASKDCILAALDPSIDGYARELEKPLHLVRTPEATERIGAFLSRRQSR